MATRRSERAKIARLIDANLNRANEAARVVEDWARFVLDHAGLANAAKGLRHRMQSGIDALGLDAGALLAARDTAGDVGTGLVGAHEYRRASGAELLRANFQRLEQALRVLEEYAKLLPKKGSDPRTALRGQTPFSAFESARYDAYTLEKDFASPPARPAALGDKPLMVLVGSAQTKRVTRAEVLKLAREILKGGCRLIELREKGVPDADYLALARELRAMTRKVGAVLIVNDRADIAKAADADGVHLGRGDMPIESARRLLGPSKLIGLTAHTVAELRDAESRGADYIGVGTMFSSPTKPDLPVRGPRELIPAAARCAVPCYAIGGITRANLDALCGAQVPALQNLRIAVGSAITSAKNPAAETRWFVKRLAAAAARREGR